MITRHPTLWISLSLAGLCLAFLLALAGRPAVAQTSSEPGTANDDAIADRFGDDWRLRACAGDVLTASMQSSVFNPYLELLGAGAETPLADAEGEEGTALIDGVEIEVDGVYTLTAAGERRSDRGPYTLSLTFAGAETEAEPEPAEGWLAIGRTLTGTLERRGAAAWLVHGCAGDVISLSVTSAEFAPYLELYGVDDEDLLTEDANEGSGDQARITAFLLPESGDFAAVVSGVSRRDSGVYSITLSLGGETGVSVAVDTPPTAKPPPARTPTVQAALCTAEVDGLNLRSGPGTIYAPPIGSLAAGTELRPVARDTSGGWIQIVVDATLERGWVSSGARYVTCTGNLAALPVGIIPPTPTPRPLPTATPTPLPPTATPTQPAAEARPTPPSYVVIGGGGGGDLDGNIVTDIATVSDPNGQPTFRDRIFFRMFVRDPDAGRNEGDGIDSVEFFIRQVYPDFQDVYYRREGTPGFCSFGGGEPDCNVLRLREGATWPDTNIPIENGDYEANIVVRTDNGDTPEWNLSFTIDSPQLQESAPPPDEGNGGGDSPPADLVVRIAQTAPGTDGDFVSGALAFQVKAYDPGQGNGDGDGIRNVDLRIYGPDGQEVYSRTEENAAYCAFGGGEPDCNVWAFGEHDYQWPDGQPIEAGTHLLRAVVEADDGRSAVVEMAVYVE